MFIRVTLVGFDTMTLKRFKDNRGIALIAVVLGTVLLSIMGLTMTSIVADRLSSSSENLQSVQTFYIAEGGMHYILMNDFFDDSDYSNNASPTDPPFGATSIALARVSFGPNIPTSWSIRLT